MSTVEAAAMIQDRCTLCGAKDSAYPGACLAMQRGTVGCPAAELAMQSEADVCAFEKAALCPPAELWARVQAERSRRSLRKAQRIVQATLDSGLVARPDLPCGADGCSGTWGHLGAHRIKKEAWIQTASGLAFKPWAPAASMVRIEDVAHALSHLCRFNGHTKFLYSVCQHSVLGSDAMATLAVESCPALWGLDRQRLVLLFLLHDAAEAYVGDVVSPIKRHAGGFFADHEERVAKVIYEALDVRPPSEEEQKVVNEVDLRMLATEKRDLHHAEPQSWELSHAPFDFHLHYMPPTVVRNMFLERYRDLRAAVR